VPRDLLRLSVGLERVDDLVADLEHALDAAPGTVAGAPAASGSAPRTAETVVEQVLRPLVLDRGGDLRLAGVRQGVAVLEATGSPGARPSTPGPISATEPAIS